ncbi:hypothetical protein [Kitasatospora sp. NPDC054795]
MGFARVVAPILDSGAVLGGDQGAVDQYDLAAAPGYLAKRPAHARGPGGEQADHLIAPAPQSGLGHVVAAGEVQHTLVVPQRGQPEHRYPARQQRPPRGTPPAPLRPDLTHALQSPGKLIIHQAFTRHVNPLREEAPGRAIAIPVPV